MIRGFGLDTQFLKCFLSSDRDFDEVSALLNYMEQWNKDNFDDLKELVKKSTVFFL